jgi:hypothetical protein
MTQWKCHHGFTLSQQCRECEILMAIKVINTWKPEVEAAERRIEELTKEQPCTS